MVGKNLKTILEAAIKIEEQSYMLYRMAQGKVKYASSKKFLEELAQEEVSTRRNSWLYWRPRRNSLN